MKKIELSTGRTVEMREPKVKDMMAVGDISNEMQREVNLVGNLTGMSPDEIADLSLGDYKKLQTELTGFLS